MRSRLTSTSDPILAEPGAQACSGWSLVVIGPPASGKGTQARRLAKELGLRYLSTGALLREHMAKGTALGDVARPILDRGGYLPDDCMCEMVGEWLEGAGGDWILDGFPRSLTQGEFLGHWLAERQRRLSAAIFLEAPLETLQQRILDRVECRVCRWSGGRGELDESKPPRTTAPRHSRGEECKLNENKCPECGAIPEARADDTFDNFMSRHQAFLSSAKPVVESYRRQGVLCACDASGPRDDVTSKLLASLKALAESLR